MKGNSHLTKEFKFDVAEDGTFEGILASYNNVDLGGDLIEPGAFTKTIQENGATVKLLWQHQPEEPIGSLTLVDSPDALCVQGKLLLELPTAQKAYLCLKNRLINGLSIGYDTVKSVWEGSVRHLKEVRLWEGSVVTFPMDTHALIMTVKSARERKDDFAAELTERQLLDAGQQMIDSLQTALYSLFWSSDLSTADKLSMAQTSIQQFSDGYLAWLPDFLGYVMPEYGDVKRFQLKLEHKEGREISASNKKKLKSAHTQIVSAAELILPLWQPEAGADPDNDGDVDDPADTTSDTKAGRKSEPEFLHSAAQSLEELRSLLRTA